MGVKVPRLWRGRGWRLLEHSGRTASVLILILILMQGQVQVPVRVQVRVWVLGRRGKEQGTWRMSLDAHHGHHSCHPVHLRRAPRLARAVAGTVTSGVRLDACAKAAAPVVVVVVVVAPPPVLVGGEGVDGKAHIVLLSRSEGGRKRVAPRLVLVEYVLYVCGNGLEGFVCFSSFVFLFCFVSVCVLCCFRFVAPRTKDTPRVAAAWQPTASSQRTEVRPHM